MRTVFSVWIESVRFARQNGAILLPFLLIALLQTVGLLVYYGFPESFYARLFSDPIRLVFGDAFLRYPGHLALTPYLHSKLETILLLILSPWMAAALVKMIWSGSSFLRSAVDALPRYFSFMAVAWIPAFLGRYLVVWGKMLLGAFQADFAFNWPSFIVWPALVLGGFAWSLAFETLFLFAIPLLVIEGTSIWDAVKRSAAGAWRNVSPLIFIVGAPMVFLAFMRVLFDPVMMRGWEIAPELILIVLGLYAVLSALANTWLIINSVVFLKIRSS